MSKSEKIQLPDLGNAKIEWVALGDMTVSAMAQREFRQHHADKILSNFDVNAIGIPSISWRDGKAYIVDHQHAVWALKQWLGVGWEKVKIQCQTFHGLSEQEEARLFLRLNNTLTVNSIDKFKASVTGGLPEAVAVNAILKNAGLRVSVNHNAVSESEHGISCIGAVMGVFSSAGGKGLVKVISIIQNAWGNGALGSNIIKGLGLVVKRYGTAFDEKQAIEKLGEIKGGVNGLIQRANAIKLRTGASIAIGVAAATVDLMNMGTRKKLPNWWNTADTE